MQCFRYYIINPFKMDEITALYRDAFPHAARIIRQLGGDEETARDLFHDAMIVYLEKSRKGTLQVEVSAKAYLLGITKILWLKQYRDKPVPLNMMEHNLSVPADFYAPARQAPLLERLSVAGARCMQLLQAFYYDRLNMRQIAEQFRYGSTHSATVQKYKCLEKVREQVKLNDVYEETIA